MPIYRACDVDKQPEIYLERWSIRQTCTGSQHFVGFNIEGQGGRVSSRIVELDCARRVGVTESGRRYRLLGRAGHNSDAEYVWNWYVQSQGIESWEDVTPVLIPDWRRGVAYFEQGNDLNDDLWVSYDGGEHDDVL